MPRTTGFRTPTKILVGPLKHPLEIAEPYLPRRVKGIDPAGEMIDFNANQTESESSNVRSAWLRS